MDVIKYITNSDRNWNTDDSGTNDPTKYFECVRSSISQGCKPGIKY
jgi:hypothetical protein